MRHARSGKKLGRDSAHRKALYSNLAGALITHGRIETTEAKAKAVKPFAEKMITLGKRGDLHARRLAMAELRSNDVVHRLFSEVAPRFAERPGGYTRVVKLGPRQGDAAQMALLELVDSRPGRRRLASRSASGIRADPASRGASRRRPSSLQCRDREPRRLTHAHDRRGRPRAHRPPVAVGSGRRRRRPHSSTWRRRGSSSAGRSGAERPSASRRSSAGRGRRRAR